MSLSILPIPGIPRLEPGDDLTAEIFTAMDRCGLRFGDGDVLVVCQKVVSKVEGRVVDLHTITPSPLALQVASVSEHKDPRLVEVILQETKRIVRMDRGHLIVETRHGWVCANAGIDSSNSGGRDRVVLLPIDPDASARRIAAAVKDGHGAQIAVIITDTFGRPWREGLVDFALGVAGIAPLLDLRGTSDMDGRQLHHTMIAQVDALAAAAGLLMQKAAGNPATLIRGFSFTPTESCSRQLVRAPEKDLFR